MYRTTCLLTPVPPTHQLGWELGTIESICLTIVAGFSVDYVVHLAHAYTHNSGIGGGAGTGGGAGAGGGLVLASRAERVRGALGEMGISVLSGMATSVLASVPLFMCIIMTFNKFGSFLCMTVVFSWVWANFCFMGLCAQLGPEAKREPRRQEFDKGVGGGPSSPEGGGGGAAVEKSLELEEISTGTRTV